MLQNQTPPASGIYDGLESGFQVRVRFPDYVNNLTFLLHNNS